MEKENCYHCSDSKSNYKTESAEENIPAFGYKTSFNPDFSSTRSKCVKIGTGYLRQWYLNGDVILLIQIKFLNPLQIQAIALSSVQLSI